MSSTLGADLYLAWRALVVHPLAKLLGRHAAGKQAFLDRYGTEGLVPTTSEDKAMLAAAGRCISCGLCDQLDGQLGTLSRVWYDGASLMPRQYARSSVEIGYSRKAIEGLDPEAYREGEAVCPTRVPLVQLGYWLKRRLERMEPLQGTATPGNQQEAVAGESPGAQAVHQRVGQPPGQPHGESSGAPSGELSGEAPLGKPPARSSEAPGSGDR